MSTNETVTIDLSFLSLVVESVGDEGGGGILNELGGFERSCVGDEEFNNEAKPSLSRLRNVDDCLFVGDKESGDVMVVVCNIMHSFPNLFSVYFYFIKTSS